MKRAISPIIAAILLLGFTVAIGTLVIQWGSQYAKQQTFCLTVGKAFSFIAVNKGTNYIDANVMYIAQNPLAYNDVVIRLVTQAGNVYVCQYQATATSPPTGGCVFTVSTTATGVNQFQYKTVYNIKILVDSATIPVDNIRAIEVYLPVCDSVIGSTVL